MEDAMPGPTTRTTKLDLRLSPDAKRTLTEAARATHRSVSQFVLESALARADETLVERQRFELDADHWAAFMAALDAPPRELPRLRRLFNEATPFDPPAAG
jgi:uncharacterized protein (DUF1778 family)